MPFYEYQCQACGHEFEALQKMSDAALEDCPSCKKSELKKLISAAGFQLKGTGSYETDFKGGDNKSTAKTESKSQAAPSCAGGACGCKH